MLEYLNNANRLEYLREQFDLQIEFFEWSGRFWQSAKVRATLSAHFLCPRQALCKSHC